MGQAPKGDSYNTTNIGLPLVAGAGDFEAGRVKASKFTTQPTKRAAAGEILIGIRASIGERALSEREVCLGRGVAALRPGRDLDARYLWHWIAEASPRLAAKGRGATFKQVNRRDIGEMSLSLPSLDSQRRIAQVLDLADSLRAKRAAAIGQLEAVPESVFVGIFGDPRTNGRGWTLGRVDDLVESVSYGSSSKAGSSGDFPMLRMGNITTSGRIDMTDLKYIDLPAAAVDRYTVRQGDVLFNRTNSRDLVGKTAVYRAASPVAFAGYLIRVRMSDRHDPEYLAGYLNTRYAKRKLKSMCRSIVGMANINAKELRAMEIPIVPQELQSRFAQLQATVERERSRHLTHLGQLDALFASLQRRAFADAL